MSAITRLMLILLCCIVYSCSSDPLDVDISSIDVKLKAERLDEDLFMSESDSMKDINIQLLSKYGEFYELYLGDIIQQGSPYDPMVDFNLSRFVNDIDMQDVFSEIQRAHPDVNWLADELTTGFKYYKYHFPKTVVPRLVVYHSGFNYGTYCTDSVLGVGLEMYLGANNDIVKALPIQAFPQYVKDKMDPKYMVVDAMTNWVHTNHFEYRENMTFLETIVEMGKIMYVLDAVLPNTTDADKVHYNEQQYAWCVKNEENIWRELIDQDLLFSKDQNEIFKFIADGPFTTGLPHESPARVGTWVGWQIVRSFMEANPKTSIERMLSIEDAEAMLKHYKPDR